MPQINVDGLEHRDEISPENWRDLLDRLETGDGPTRRVVTAVRFGGVAVPTFREAETLSRSLRDVASVDVKTLSVEELLRESAQAASESIAPLKGATVRIADRLRHGHELAALRDLPALTSSIQTLATVTAALAQAEACVSPHRADLDGLVARFCRLTDLVTARQVAADWRGVADTLERELMPTYEAWTLVARRVWKLA